MEAQLHRDHDDLHPAVNDSPVVRSGLAEPTVMGTPVLAEDLYATHSDIVDTPVRSFAEWKDEERHHAPPPLSTDYVNREQLKGGVGITGVLKSFDKMNIYNEPDQPEQKVYTGSHDQFAPEPVETPPLDTITDDPSNPSSSYTQRISSATTAVADKAAAVKDTIVSKLSSSGDNKTEGSTTTVTHKASTKSSFPTEFSHRVAETLSSTLGPVYERVAEAGGSVMSKMHEESTGGSGVGVKEYLVDRFKPGDDDKVLSEVITHALHMGKRNQQPQETSTTTYVVRDEGERRGQDSGN